ncbi:unnamed protein product, partial [Polarella glacialis]
MSLCTRCSEIVYAYAELVNALGSAGLARYRGQKIAGMMLCVGFVTHEYRELCLDNDFGNVFWQHSPKIHNNSRNHVWLEFPTPGASPHDQSRRQIVDLSACQFDIPMPNGQVIVIPGQDKRYTKCYEIPLSALLG